VNPFYCLLIYAVVLFRWDAAAKLSFIAMSLLIAVGYYSRQLFSYYELHFAFDYLIKLTILIPWTFLLYSKQSQAFIIIFSACCFEVLMSIDALMNRGAATSLYYAYPQVVMLFHLIAGTMIIGGRNGSLAGDSTNSGGSGHTGKASKGDV
jgi:hypothetical protein